MLLSVFLLLLTTWFAQTGSGFDMGMFDIPKMMDLPVLDDQLLFNLTNLINSVNQKGLNLTECYNPMIGDKKVDIFTTEFMDVLKQFQDINKDLFTLTDTPKRIKAFMESIIGLVNLIVECVSKPEKKRTKFGVTRLSAYSKDEFKHMLGLRHQKLGNYAFDYGSPDNNHYNPNGFDYGSDNHNYNPIGFDYGSDNQHYNPNEFDDNNPFNRPDYPSFHDQDYPYNPLTNPPYKSADGNKVPPLDPNAMMDQNCEQYFDYQGEIPDKFDWRDKGIVTPVKNQLTCQGCFVFSSIAAVESSYKQKHGQEKDFSEQALINCFQGDVCESGGMEIEAWYGMKQNGIVDESSSTYKHQVEQCQDLPRVAEIEGYCYAQFVTARQIQAVLLQKGPVTVGIDAKHDSFFSLHGEYNYGDCTEAINHSVLLVGWDEKYWILKNSWGPDWGKDGYLYLDRTQDNMCGINTSVGAVWVK